MVLCGIRAAREVPLALGTMLLWEHKKELWGTFFALWVPFCYGDTMLLMEYNAAEKGYHAVVGYHATFRVPCYFRRTILLNQAI